MVPDRRKESVMSDDGFNVRVVQGTGRAIVYARGEIDIDSGQAFREALCCAQQDAPDVLVDLSEVAFMDSTGVNALMRAYQRTPNPGSLRVVSPSAAVRRVLEITGVAELLLTEPRLTWRQVTYHTSGWRQWMTAETNQGAPVAEIVEVGPCGNRTGDSVHYALETNGESTLYRSLDEAMKAAECLGSVAPPTSKAERPNVRPMGSDGAAMSST